MLTDGALHFHFPDSSEVQKERCKAEETISSNDHFRTDSSLVTMHRGCMVGAYRLDCDLEVPPPLSQNCAGACRKGCNSDESVPGCLFVPSRSVPSRRAVPSRPVPYFHHVPCRPVPCRPAPLHPVPSRPAPSCPKLRGRALWLLGQSLPPGLWPESTTARQTNSCQGGQ